MAGIASSLRADTSTEYGKHKGPERPEFYDKITQKRREEITKGSLRSSNRLGFLAHFGSGKSR